MCAHLPHSFRLTTHLDEQRTSEPSLTTSTPITTLPQRTGASRFLITLSTAHHTTIFFQLPGMEGWLNTAKTQSPRASIITAWKQASSKITQQMKNHRRQIRHTSAFGLIIAASSSIREPPNGSLTSPIGKLPMATGMQAENRFENMTLCVRQFSDTHRNVPTQDVTLGS